MRYFLLFMLLATQLCAQNNVSLWAAFESSLTSDQQYENPLYDVKEFKIELTSPSGAAHFNHFISAAKTDNDDSIIAYTAQKTTIKLFNPRGYRYSGQWFDPVNNKFVDADVKQEGGILQITPPAYTDMLLVLAQEK